MNGCYLWVERKAVHSGAHLAPRSSKSGNKTQPQSSTYTSGPNSRSILPSRSRFPSAGNKLGGGTHNCIGKVGDHQDKRVMINTPGAIQSVVATSSVASRRRLW